MTINSSSKLLYEIRAAHYPLFARFRHATGIVIGQLKEVFHARHISFSFSLASTRQTIQLVYKDKAASKVITNSTSDKHLFVSMQLKPSKSHNSTIKAIMINNRPKTYVYSMHGFQGFSHCAGLAVFNPARTH